MTQARWIVCALASVVLFGCPPPPPAEMDADVPDGGADGDGGGAMCGNGIVETGEQCDPPGATCSATCLFIGACGEGIQVLEPTSTNGDTTAYVGDTSLAPARDNFQSPAGCSDPVAGGADAVHRYVVPFRADLLVTTDTAITRNAMGDTVVYAYDTMCGTPANLVGCNDDVDGGNTASIVWIDGVTAGQELFIVVDTWPGAGGTPARPGPYELDVTAIPLRAIGATCDPTATADHCDVGSYCDAIGMTCVAGTAPVLTSLQVFNFRTVPCTAPSGMCNVYEVIMPGTDTEGDVVNGGGTFTVGAATSDPFDFDLARPVTGQTSFTAYSYLWIDSTAAVGSFSLHLNDASRLSGANVTAAVVPIPRPATGAACDPTVHVDLCPTGDVCYDPAVSGSGNCALLATAQAAACAAAPALVPGATAEGDTVLDYESVFEGGCRPGAPVGGPVNERVFTLTLATRSDVTLTTDTAATNYDTLIYLRSSCSSAAGEICNDNVNAINRRSRIRQSAMAAGTYWVFVEGPGMNAVGHFGLLATLTPVRAAGETCDPAGVADRCDTGLVCSDPGTGPVCM